MVFAAWEWPRLLLLARRLLGGSRGLAQPLRQHGVHARDVAACVANQHRVLELIGGLLEAVLEQILLELVPGPAQLLGIVPLQVLGTQSFHMTPCRATNRVCTDSLCSARWKASRARSS